MGVEFTQSGNDIIIREGEDGETTVHLNEFILIEFEEWWEKHLPLFLVNAPWIERQNYKDIARRAWTEAYCRGLDVNY